MFEPGIKVGHFLSVSKGQQLKGLKYLGIRLALLFITAILMVKYVRFRGFEMTAVRFLNNG